MLCASCVLSNDADIEFPGSDQTLMLECYLTPGRNFELRLMENNNFKDDIVLQLVWNADISISSQNQDVNLRNILNIEESTKYVFNYGVPELVPNDYSGDYILDIVTENGEHLKAKTHTVEFVPILNAVEEDNTLSVSFELTDKIIERYFVVIAEGESDEDLEQIVEDFDLSQLNNGNVSLSLRGDFMNWNTLKLKLLHIDKEHFLFRKSIDNAYSANIDPFTVPTQLNSNTEGGLGIFTFYTVDSLQIR